MQHSLSAVSNLQQPLTNQLENTHFSQATEGCQGVIAQSLGVCERV